MPNESAFRHSRLTFQTSRELLIVSLLNISKNIWMSSVIALIEDSGNRSSL